MKTLSKLVHLTELSISGSTDIYLDTIDQARLKPLSSVRILKLCPLNLIDSGSMDSRGATFCRIFSRLFPNIEELTVWSDGDYKIKPHHERFANLHKHDIQVFDAEKMTNKLMIRCSEWDGLG